MVKVKCKICGDIGYTASPAQIICKCGGRFRMIRWKREEMIVKEDFGILSLFNLSGPLNYENN